jgi:CspA family cold shock protein
MTTGKIGSFHPDKGYGYIQTDDSDSEVFFHIEDAEEVDLEEGKEVEFDIERAPEGSRAKNLNRITSKPAGQELSEFFENHTPEGDFEVNIEVTESELNGQFERLHKNLYSDLDDAKSTDDLFQVSKIIRSIIEHRLEADQIEMNEEMREATANVIASTLAQEYDQVSEKS